jgi:tetratricopeptide (TPR) repeat protein
VLVWLPGLWKIPNWRIRRLSEMGRHKEAGRVAARYVRLRPSDPRGWVDWGDCLIRAQDFDAAAAAMEEGIQRHPSEARLVYFLALARLGQGNLDEAERVLYTPRPELSEPFFVILGRVRLAIARGHWAQAVALGRQTAESIPVEWAWGKFELGTIMMVFRSADDLTERLLREAAARYPPSQSNYARSCLYLGALIEKTRPDEAKTFFEQARRHWRERNNLDGHLSMTRSTLAAPERQSR